MLRSLFSTLVRVDNGLAAQLKEALALLGIAT
jgi:hypothetical protein